MTDCPLGLAGSDRYWSERGVEDRADRVVARGIAIDRFGLEIVETVVVDVVAAAAAVAAAVVSAVDIPKSSIVAHMKEEQLIDPLG